MEPIDINETYDTLEVIPESIRHNYEQHSDGKFALKSVKGLRVALHRERENVATATRTAAQLREQFAGVDPKVLAALKDHAPDAVIAHLGTLRSPLQVAEAELARVKGETARIQSEAALTTALTVAGAAANEVLQFCKGAGLEYKAGGKVALGEEEFASAEALALALRDRIPGLYRGSANAGGAGTGHGAAPANGGKPPAAKAPTSRAKMSLSDKTSFIKAHGTDKFMQLPK